jgi:hypothetical protein
MRDCTGLEAQMTERMMRGVVLAALMLATWPSSALAQDDGRRGWGYGFVGTASVDREAVIMMGGGVERVLVGDVGIGAELGYLALGSGLGNGLGMLAVGPTAHFTRSARASPFVTGGASAIFNGWGGAAGGHAGGGVQWWPGRRAALRAEYRALLLSRHVTHSVRVGIGFR